MEVQFANKRTLKKAALIMLITSILFVIFGVVSTNKSKTNKDVYASVESIITKVEKTKVNMTATNKKGYKHKAYVSYTYEGEDYTSILPSYDLTMKEGKNLTVYIQQDNPSVVVDFDGVTAVILFAIAGLMFLIFLFAMYGVIRS